ncbi:MAG: cysteine peptidase family C39 domain-containing protein [Eggerthellaceae bacterium]
MRGGLPGHDSGYYYGKWVPLEQVRADCGVSRDGSKASNVVRAARAYGFEASGFRMQPGLRSQGVFPCIVHWNFSHFVVCRGFKGGKVHLNDPARGEVTVTEGGVRCRLHGRHAALRAGSRLQPSASPGRYGVCWAPQFRAPRRVRGHHGGGDGRRRHHQSGALPSVHGSAAGWKEPGMAVCPFIALLIAVGAVRIVVEVLNAHTCYVSRARWR